MEHPTTPRPASPIRIRTVAALSVVALLCIVGLTALLSRPNTRAETTVNSLPDEKPSPIAESLDPPKAKRVETPPPPAEPQKPVGELQRARTGEYNSTDKSTDWSVIAATFNDWDAADRRARSLRAQWQKCDCTVFPPKGQGGKYFVVLGSGLGRNDADRLRDTATAAGMPPDTYVTKLIRTSTAAE